MKDAALAERSVVRWIVLMLSPSVCVHQKTEIKGECKMIKNTIAETSKFICSQNELCERSETPSLGIFKREQAYSQIPLVAATVQSNVCRFKKRRLHFQMHTQIRRTMTKNTQWASTRNLRQKSSPEVFSPEEPSECMVNHTIRTGREYCSRRIAYRFRSGAGQCTHWCTATKLLFVFYERRERERDVRTSRSVFLWLWLYAAVCFLRSKSGEFELRRSQPHLKWSLDEVHFWWWILPFAK